MMSDDEKLAALAADGKLIKRPLLVDAREGKERVLVGFREPAYEALVGLVSLRLGGDLEVDRQVARRREKYGISWRRRRRAPRESEEQLEHIGVGAYADSGDHQRGGGVVVTIDRGERQPERDRVVRGG